jgi:hypothetical protein
MRFFSKAIDPGHTFVVLGADEAAPLASAIAQTLPNVQLAPDAKESKFPWSEIVEQKTELWPIQYLLPGGAYIH